MPIRIGSVAYLNAMPLIAGLAVDPAVELVTDSPAGIAQRLERGELDAGLVPVAEAARQNLWALPGPAVAARGPVRSVFLISRGEPARIVCGVCFPIAPRQLPAIPGTQPHHSP